MSKPLILSNEVLLGEVAAQLTAGRCVKLRLKGNSMRPFIREGDLIHLAPLPRPLRYGDVVLAKTLQGQYVAHRVVRPVGRGSKDLVSLAGDGNLFLKEKCRREAVYGCITHRERRGVLRRLDAPSLKFLAVLWRGTLPLRRLAWRLWRVVKKVLKIC